MSNFTQEQLQTVTRNAEGQVIINPEIFAAQVNIGWKKTQLANHYEIPQAAVGEILTQLGLKLRKFKKKTFVIEGIAPGVETIAANTTVAAEVVVEDELEDESQEATAEEVAEANNIFTAQEVAEEEAVPTGTVITEQESPVRSSWTNN